MKIYIINIIYICFLYEEAVNEYMDLKNFDHFVTIVEEGQINTSLRKLDMAQSSMELHTQSITRRSMCNLDRTRYQEH